MPGPLSRVDVLNFPTSFNVGNLPATQPVSGTVNVNGTVPVSGTFWPATQPVSGTVTANVAFPATQAVSQSGSWAVNQAGTWNVAATQSGNWAVTASGTVSLTAGTSVAVSNFPASQAVTGTFWQATQPISAASLPLPAGAATAAGVAAIVTALGNRLNVDSYRVPNGAAAGAIVPKVATDTASFIASAVPCNFFGGVVISRPDAASCYVFFLNRTTVPAANATINMAEVMAMTGYSGGGGASIVPDQVPDRYTAGCVIVVSTSIDTYTPPTGNSRPKYIKARVV
jgi:hypothetical protein